MCYRDIIDCVFIDRQCEITSRSGRKSGNMLGADQQVKQCSLHFVVYFMQKLIQLVQDIPGPIQLYSAITWPKHHLLLLPVLGLEKWFGVISDILNLRNGMDFRAGQNFELYFGLCSLFLVLQSH